MNNNVKKEMVIDFIVSSIALMFFLVIMALVLSDYSFKIDKFNIVISNNRNAFLTGFFKVFTHLGSFYTLAVLALVGVGYLLFVKKEKRLAAFYGVCFAKVCIANLLLKLIIRRVRPEHLMIINETGFSFPSGHAMMTLAFFFLLGHFVCKTIKNNALKISLVSIFSLIVVAIGFSRIYLGVHYLTDILAGWLITISILMSGLIVYKSKMFKFLKDKR